jgi:hypothetical protein
VQTTVAENLAAVKDLRAKAQSAVAVA